MYKITVFILLQLIIYNFIIYSTQIPKCCKCKWFKYNNGEDLCKMFGKKVFYKDDIIIIFENIHICRKNENLCGRKGYLYENINDSKININYHDSNKILYDFFHNYYNYYTFYNTTFLE